MKPALIFTFLILVAQTAVSGESTASIKLTVEGAEPGTGQFLIYLFDSEETFLNDFVFRTFIQPDEEGRASLEITNLEKGDYAISVIYDENGNGKLDTGAFRIPKERFGFSNNAKGILGPPSFNQARFRLEEESKQNIRVGKAR